MISASMAMMNHAHDGYTDMNDIWARAFSDAQMIPSTRAQRSPWKMPMAMKNWKAAKIRRMTPTVVRSKRMIASGVINAFALFFLDSSLFLGLSAGTIQNSFGWQAIKIACCLLAIIPVKPPSRRGSFWTKQLLSDILLDQLLDLGNQLRQFHY